MKRTRLFSAIAAIALVGGATLASAVAYADTNIYGPIPGSRAIMPTGAAADVPANWVNYVKAAGQGLVRCQRQQLLASSSYTEYTSDRDFVILAVRSDGISADDVRFSVPKGTVVQSQAGKAMTQIVACFRLTDGGFSNLTPTKKSEPGQVAPQPTQPWVWPTIDYDGADANGSNGANGSNQPGGVIPGETQPAESGPINVVTVTASPSPAPAQQTTYVTKTTVTTSTTGKLPNTGGPELAIAFLSAAGLISGGLALRRSKK